MQRRSSWLLAIAVAIIAAVEVCRPIALPVALAAPAGGPSGACSVDVNAGKVADVDAAVAGSGGLRLMGFASRESAAIAAVAKFAIVNGATANGGTVVAPINLAPGESAREWYGPGGILCTSGISIDVSSGTVDVELYYIDD
jgi:hypothetical protein